MKNVVSTALFGDAAKYQAYLPAAIRAHHNVYRGWSFRIYHDRLLDEGPYAGSLRALEKQGLVELILVDEPVLHSRAFLWRLLPLWDKQVDRFLCRDIDTVPGYRERCAVEEWIKSDLAFHAISDKRGHHDFQTLGGMIGFQVKQARKLLGDPTSFDDLLSRAQWAECDWSGKYRKSQFTMNDQLFLLEQIWSRVHVSTCEHRLSGSRVFPEAKLSLQEAALINIPEINKDVQKASDMLVPFIGSSEIDLERALTFYKKHGNHESERAISKCEQKSTKVTGGDMAKAKSKPKVILVSDVRGWAFDQNMRDLAEYLSDKFDFEHFYTDEWYRGSRIDWAKCDAIFECYHRNPDMGIPYGKTAGALRSEWFSPEAPTAPTPADIALVNRHAAFQVAVKRNYDELIAKCPNVFYLTNPVNMRRFKKPTPLRKNIVAEWNGNAGHKSIDGRYIKHFRDIVIPACQQAGVTLVAAEYGTSRGEWRRREPAEMPDFYQQANVALCASEYEAASNSVLEAMASGLAVIATDVGNHREMYDAQMKAFGNSGIVLVDRNVNAFVAALKAMSPQLAHEMGQINRAEIEARWSWTAWAPKYEELLDRVLERSKTASKWTVMPPPPPAPPPRRIATTPASVSAPLVTRAQVAVASPAPAKRTPMSKEFFTYWNKVDPANFLSDDWKNPSREWAGRAVEAAIKQGSRTMVEVGPGIGVDYESQFKKIDGLCYTGFEGSSNFCSFLQKKFPESKWENQALLDLPSAGFDIAYSRAVLEHQPALEPHLSRFLGAAKKLAILIWYRRPAAAATSEFSKDENVHYHTFRRDEVLDVVKKAGWKITEEKPFDSGNLGWRLERLS